MPSPNVFHYNMVTGNVCVIITNWFDALYLTTRKNVVNLLFILLANI